jgi:hypothetical protein
MNHTPDVILPYINIFFVEERNESVVDVNIFEQFRQIYICFLLTPLPALTIFSVEPHFGQNKPELNLVS